MKAKSLIMSILMGLSSVVVNADSALVKRISETLAYQESTGYSYSASISPDGTHIAFVTIAGNLSGLDVNGRFDIYLFDTEAKTCVPVSLTASGVIGNQNSFLPAVSRGGGFVAFSSLANNLVPHDTNGVSDIFVKNMQTGEITMVSVASNGTQGDGSSINPKISADGNLIVFSSTATNLVADDTNIASDVFVHDLKRGRTWRVSVGNSGEEGNGASFSPDISSDGKFVTFSSRANNLVTDDTNGFADIFVCPVKGRNKMELISSRSSGEQGNNDSLFPAISADGRYLVFQSLAGNLVSGDTNGNIDIFLVDRENESIKRINMGPGRAQANGDSYSPVVTREGKVYYHSYADNLVDGDTNGEGDVFSYDGYHTYITSKFSNRTLANRMSASPSVSDDDELVAFESPATNLVDRDTNGVQDIFFKGNSLGINKLKRASVTSYALVDSNGDSSSPSISQSGRYIAFESAASNLVPGDNNRANDVFIYNRLSGEIKRYSVGDNGEETNNASIDPKISADGGGVVFASAATNLVDGDTNGCYDIFLKQCINGATYRVMGAGGVQPNNHCYQPVPGNNRQVAFYSPATNLVAGDANGCSDVFVANVLVNSIERVSVSSAGVEGNGASAYPAMTPDARYVAFVSAASNLVHGDTNRTIDVFVYDLEEHTIERVSLNNEGEQGNGNCWTPDISEDGRYVSFSSSSDNLVAGDSNGVVDVFVYDRQENTIVRASLSEHDMQANGESVNAKLSASGRYVVFESEATNLVSGDSNRVKDVFVRDLRGGRTTRLSQSELLSQADAACETPAISGNGLNVVFSTTSGLVDQDDNGLGDIFFALNPQPALVPGKVFSLSGAEVEGFTDMFFSSRPNVTAAFRDPLRGRPRRKRGRVLSDVGGGVVVIGGDIECLWTSKVSLYNRSSALWKNSYCRDVMTRDLTTEVDLLVSTQLADGTRLENAPAGQKLLVAPEISWVVDVVTGVYGVPVEPEQVLQVGGAFFGTKPPKAWLEYKDAKGKVKQAKCRVERICYFNDYVGHAGRSCMDVNTGYSVINVQLPRTWPKGWIPGRHDLVIDNGCGRAFFRILTD